jgi:hypothetical protein
MIEQYNRISLSNFFDYNDPLIEEWAENVYEKIRQNGELANYVKRDKIIRERFNVEDDPGTGTILIDNSEFTFGNAYCGILLPLVDGRTENLGKIYQVEFEVLFNEYNFGNINFFDSYVVIRSEGTVTVGSIVFSGITFQKETLYKFKIIRNNLMVSLYIDEVLIGTGILNQDIDIEFQILYQSSPIPPVYQYDHDDYSDDYS